jgi:hypothetical protein
MSCVSALVRCPGRFRTHCVAGRVVSGCGCTSMTRGRECVAWALLAWLQPLRLAQPVRIAHHDGVSR